MFFSIAESSSSAEASFSFAIREASALPSLALTNSARSSGKRARRVLIAEVCASKSAGGGVIACSSDNFFSSSWSTASFSWILRSTAFTSRSHNSAALLASSRRCRIGFFSASNLAIASRCSFAFASLCASIFLIPSSIWVIRSATSFCSCSSFFKATISFRNSGKFAACEVPSRPSAISLLWSKRFSWRRIMRVLCRRIFNPISRRPVRMKLTVLLLGFGQLCQDAEIFERCRVACHFRAAGDFLQQTPHNFPAPRLWQRLSEPHLIRFRDRADMYPDMFAQFAFQIVGSFHAGFQSNESDYALAFQFVGPPNDRGLGNFRVTYQSALNLGCSKPVSRNIEDIVDPADDPEITILVATRTIAGQIISLVLAPV